MKGRETDDAPIPVAFVHWGRVSDILRGAITVTLAWGNDVTLLSNFHVNDSMVKLDGRPSLAARFRWRLHNTSGGPVFKEAYDALHKRDRALFKGYNKGGEYWNELRYTILYNFMEAEGIEKLVHLDSDVALLDGADAVFPSRLYAGCDAVITFNQVSARMSPVDATGLEAFWAGTALLSRKVLRDYVRFAIDVYTEEAGVQVQLAKMRNSPTINDMSTWCLFTIACNHGQRGTPILGAGARSVFAKLAASRRLAGYAGRHTICNTQPHSWSGTHGVVHSASGELGFPPASMLKRNLLSSTAPHMHTVSRRGLHFYVDGQAYLKGLTRSGGSAQPSDHPYLSQPLLTAVEANRTRGEPLPLYRLLSVHIKTLGDTDQVSARASVSIPRPASRPRYSSSHLAHLLS